MAVSKQDSIKSVCVNIYMLCSTHKMVIFVALLALSMLLTKDLCAGQQRLRSIMAVMHPESCELSEQDIYPEKKRFSARASTISKGRGDIGNLMTVAIFRCDAQDYSVTSASGKIHILTEKTITGAIIAYSPLTHAIAGVATVQVSKESSYGNFGNVALLKEAVNQAIAKKDRLTSRFRTQTLDRRGGMYVLKHTANTTHLMQGDTVTLYQEGSTQSIACVVMHPKQDYIPLRCPKSISNIPLNAASFNVSVGLTETRYQVRQNTISSNKARELFSDNLKLEQDLLAFSFNEVLAERGMMGLLPENTIGRALKNKAFDIFASVWAVSLSKRDKTLVPVGTPIVPIAINVAGFDVVPEKNGIFVHKNHVAFVEITNMNSKSTTKYKSLATQGEEIDGWENHISRQTTRQAMKKSIACNIDYMLTKKVGKKCARSL